MIRYFRKEDGGILSVDEKHPGNDQVILKIIEEGLVEISWPPTPTAEEIKATLKYSAHLALAATSNTMERIIEGVSLGTCKLNNVEVIAFMSYRKALRDIMTGTDTTSTSLPIKPPHPKGT
jgi:hypothetical protein